MRWKLNSERGITHGRPPDSRLLQQLESLRVRVRFSNLRVNILASASNVSVWRSWFKVFKLTYWICHFAEPKAFWGWIWWCYPILGTPPERVLNHDIEKSFVYGLSTLQPSRRVFGSGGAALFFFYRKIFSWSAFIQIYPQISDANFIQCCVVVKFYLYFRVI